MTPSVRSLSVALAAALGAALVGFLPFPARAGCDAPTRSTFEFQLPELTLTHARSVRVEVLRFDPPSISGDPSGDRLTLIVPPTGGETWMDRAQAERICVATGARAWVASSWEGASGLGIRAFWETPKDIDLDLHDRETELGVAVLRSLIDRSGASRVGVLGTSLGAFYASVLAGVDHRVLRAALIVGAGDNPHVVAHSRQRFLGRVRAARAELGIAPEQPRAHEEALRSHARFDPLRFAQPELRDRIWMLIATEDEVVPSEDQWKLWRAWGQPETETVSSGHYGAIFYAYWSLQDRIAQWFRSGLRSLGE